MTGPALRPLVLRFGALGDLILLTPLLRLLHRRYGAPCTLVTSGAWATPLFAGHPDVDRLLVLRSRRRPWLLDPQQWALARALAAYRDSPVYVCDVHALDKLRRLLAHAGIAPEHCIFDGEHPVPFAEHWIDRWLRIGRLTPPAFRAADYPWRETDLAPVPILAVSAGDRTDRDAWLAARGLASHPLLLLQPGNKRTLKRGRLGSVGDNKAWPVEHWAALARGALAAQSDLRVVLCGAPPEAALLESIRVAAGDPKVLVAAADLPVRRLLALLEVASGMISIDTGPAHAAAALGCPLVVLFGSAPPTLWRPRSAGSAVALLGGAPGARVAAIPPDAVLAAWRSLGERVAD